LKDSDINFEEIEKTNDRKWYDLKEPLEIKVKDGSFVNVDSIYYNGLVETMKIEMEDGEIFECSYNHRFLVNRDGFEKWIRVDELLEGDDIVTI
jgi:major membrane immunogen (membrane-anchored lipoprotein)